MNAAWRRLTGKQPGLVSEDWVALCQGTLRIDPYLVWSDLTKFHWTEKGKGEPEWIPFLIETSSGASVLESEVAQSLKLGKDELRKRVLIPTAYRRELTPGGSESRFLTALIRPKLVLTVARLPSVLRMKLGLARKGRVDFLPFEEKRPPVYSRTDRPAKPSPDAAEKKLVLGIIDDGCNFAHQDYRVGPDSRVVRLWDQNDLERKLRPKPQLGHKPPWSGKPRYLGYGLVLAQPDIRAQLATSATERAIYEKLYPPADPSAPSDPLQEPDEPNTTLPLAIGTHGTGAMHLLAGACRWLPQEPILPAQPPAETDMMFVQLPNSTVNDTSSGSLCVYALDAIRYIVDRAETYAPIGNGDQDPAKQMRVMRKVVINLSYGSMSGPHDGTAVLDEAIEELATKRGDLAVVVAAGNGKRSRCHATLHLDGSNAAHVGWVVNPANPLPSTLEIWVPSDGDKLQVRLTDPDGQASDWARLGELHALKEGGRDVAWIVSAHEQAVGRKGHVVLLALAPTSGGGPRARRAPYGTWKVSLANPGGAAMDAQVWVERNDMARGSLRRQQAHLQDWDADKCTIRAEGTMCSPASGNGTVAVAAKICSTGEIAGYSGEGWQGCKKQPDSAAAVDLSPSVMGMRVAGVVTGSSLRMSGTSAAAPLVARQLARWMLDQPGPVGWPAILAQAKTIT